MEEKNIPSEYEPIGPFKYWGYNLLFAIPVIGTIFLIVFAFSSSNINRRNYARSFFVGILFSIILIVITSIILGAFGVSMTTMLS